VIRSVPRQFHESDGFADWRVLGEGALVYFPTGSFAESARLVQAIGEIFGVEGHPPAVDVRAGGVAIRLIPGPMTSTRARPRPSRGRASTA